MTVRRLMRRHQGIRVWIPWISGAVLVATAMVVGFVAWGGWSLGISHNHRSDPAAVVGAAVAVVSFLLVLLGTVVAVAAYVAATGAPELELEIKFPGMDTNDLAFEVERFDDESLTGLSEENKSRFRRIPAGWAAQGTVVLRNQSAYAARNPGVLIELAYGITGASMARNSGWIATREDEQPYGVKGLQWDGGIDFIIHGRWMREIPLDFSGVKIFGDGHESLTVTVVADGYGPREWIVPVRGLLHDEWWLYFQSSPEDRKSPPERFRRPPPEPDQ